VSRGHNVSAVVRDIHRHPGLAADRISLVTGDALDPKSVAQVGAGSAAIVSAVTPFTAPPESFDSFDIGYYERVATALAEGAAQAGVGRVVIIGLFATLRTSDGGLVLEDPALPDAGFLIASHRPRGGALAPCGGRLATSSDTPPMDIQG
jgi:putative NADH-flavin reductase